MKIEVKDFNKKFEDFYEEYGFFRIEYVTTKNINDEEKNYILNNKHLVKNDEVRNKMMEIYFRRDPGFYAGNVDRIIKFQENKENFLQEKFNTIVKMFDLDVEYSNETKKIVALIDWDYYVENNIYSAFEFKEVKEKLCELSKEMKIQIIFMTEKQYNDKVILLFKKFVEDKINKTDFLQKAYEIIPELLIELIEADEEK